MDGCRRESGEVHQEAGVERGLGFRSRVVDLFESIWYYVCDFVNENTKMTAGLVNANTRRGVNG